ncbi:MAG TPA: sulfatase-like hydrolase/transferase, partial [bacterium]|nr:sulfatase-like hydrolase/transferase [bacterium]
MKERIRIPRLAMLVSGFILVAMLGCKAAKTAPNVLLITLDTVRADRLGCYGYGDIKTPNIDQLAREGILFEKAYCQVPITLPSHASILTGLYPPNHGIRLNGPYLLPSDVPTVSSLLQEKGYRTGAFVSASVLLSQFGMSRGFDIYDDEILSASTAYMPERRAAVTGQRAVNWLKSSSMDSFFLWVHFFDPHMPYDPPEPFRSQYEANPYDGEIAYVDSVLGKVLGALEETGERDNTLIILTADHGEGLGEHEETTHSLFVYDGTVRVPLILVLPKNQVKDSSPWKPGTRVSQVVETVDIVPTVLDVLGMKTALRFDGKSLLNADKETSRYAYAECLYPMSMGWCPLQTARQDQWKYIRAPRRELFDTDTDPSERANLYSDDHERARDLEKWLSGYPIYSEREASLKQNVSPEVARSLTDLGYLSLGTTVRRSEESLFKLPDPKDRTAVFEQINKAPYLMNTGHAQEALDLLIPLLKGGEHSNPVLNRMLGINYVKMGLFETGLPFLKAYRLLAEGDLESSYYLGVALLRSGSTEAALAPFRECVEAMPSYAAAWDQLAVAYGMQKDYDKALEAGTKAVEREPLNPEYLKNLGVTLLRKGLPDQAETHFAKALEVQPDSADLHHHSGLALKFQGKNEQAARSFEKALTLQPDFVDASQYLVEVLFKMGN